MKKVFLFAALTAGFILASCSSDNLTVKEQPQVQSEPGTVAFDVYTQKATTRAGWTGSVTTTALKNTATGEMGESGFGVFGYYTDNNEYEQRSVPNFMYNQQVTWNGSNAFTYEPVVYWPNEYGSSATSDDADKLTFFAYAPYVKVVPSSGKIDGATADKTLEQWGITGMTKNTAQGDPVLKYIGSFDNKKSVDLCWGVADNGDGAAWNITQTGLPQTEIKNGLPWIDLERPAGTDQKVRFTFKHATAQMRISIDADIDVDGRGHDNDVTKKTRIWVREVKFKGFTMKGSLNLNNDDASTPKWLDYNGQNELVAEDVVIYDGRKDGKEGVAGAVATNEKTLGLNPALIQDGVYAKGSATGIYDAASDVVVYGVDASGSQKSSAEWARPGVTNTAVNLFKYNNTNNMSQASAITAGEFFHVIPVNDNFEVEIVYDVETVDQNLAQSLSDGAAKGSSIENRITKTITFGDPDNKKLLAGHSYTLALHLGMNSVKFDAAVTDWIEEAAQDVDLPLNTPAFAVASNPTVTLPYTSNYSFAITGLDGGESMKTDQADNDNIVVTTDYSVWKATTANANTSGVAIQTVTTAVNPLTTDRSKTITWTGNQSNKAITMTFKQKAHPLFMAITKMVNSSTGGEITLTRYNDESRASSSDWKKSDDTYNTSGWMTASTATTSVAPVLKVWRNGTELTTGVTFVDGGTDASNTITIADKLNHGDVIKVELTTGDAPTETVTAQYEGMYFVQAGVPITEFSIPYRAKDSGAYDGDVPELKNYYTSITSYESSNGDVATVGSTDGKLTTKAVGTTTITAKDAADNTATYTLNVTKQNTEITGSTSETVDKTTSEVDDNGDVIISLSSDVKGIIDNTTTVGSCTYSIKSARDGANKSVKYKFTIDGASLKPSSSLTADTYIIVLTASGILSSGNDAKYNVPADKDITITLTVTP